MNKPPIPGGGLGMLLALINIMTLLYLNYRDVISGDTFLNWIIPCGVGSLLLGIVLMQLLCTVLYRRWQDKERARITAMRIDLIILAAVLLLSIILRSVFSHLFRNITG